MTESVTITMAAPPSKIFHNQRQGRHRYHGWKELKRYKGEAYVMGIAARVDSMPWEKVSVRYRFYWKVKRDRDGDNLIATMKPALDQFKSVTHYLKGGIPVHGAMLFVDDNAENLAVEEVGEEEVNGIDRHNPRVEITITRKD